MKKAYLGDGVYVEVENGMLKLSTSNGESDTNTIYLEREVFNNLVFYAEETDKVQIVLHKSP